jgi:hypothetical protein
MFLVVFI